MRGKRRACRQRRHKKLWGVQAHGLQGSGAAEAQGLRISGAVEAQGLRGSGAAKAQGLLRTQA